MKTQTMKKLCLAESLFMSLLTWAAPTINDLKVTPVEPIGFAIDYTISDATPEDVNRLLVVSFFAKTLDGETNCVNGTHRIYWNTAKDGIAIDQTSVKVKVCYEDGLCAGALYCVIDLSAGASAEMYPVWYLDTEPAGGFNQDEYKTTKLVLRRVDAGTFTMGSSGESNNKQHQVVLSKPFYMGIFEVTQEQWERVMGTWPNKSPSSDYGIGPSYPAYYISYADIRGSSSGMKWPTTNAVDEASFLGRLQTRTKINFDLPTEAQWEYACRAGTQTAYNMGDDEDILNNIGWYSGNAKGGAHPVGEKPANALGLYDMHGNVWECCLDWNSSVLAADTDPVGATTGTSRVRRGGSWSSAASYCTSPYRGSYNPSNSNNNHGFRLSRTLP